MIHNRAISKEKFSGDNAAQEQNHAGEAVKKGR
jgi:hypothetical protein